MRASKILLTERYGIYEYFVYRIITGKDDTIIIIQLFSKEEYAIIRSKIEFVLPLDGKKCLH